MPETISRADVKKTLKAHDRETRILYGLHPLFRKIGRAMEGLVVPNRDPLVDIYGLTMEEHPLTFLNIAEEIRLHSTLKRMQWRGIDELHTADIKRQIERARTQMQQIKEDPDNTLRFMRFLGEKNALSMLVGQDDEITGWLFEERFKDLKHPELEYPAITRMFIGEIGDLTLMMSRFFGIEGIISTGRLVGTRQEILQVFQEHHRRSSVEMLIGAKKHASIVTAAT